MKVELTELQQEIIIAALKNYKLDIDGVIRANWTPDMTETAICNKQECDTIIELLK